jgi:Domain of unknown function (DU1801)
MTPNSTLPNAIRELFDVLPVPVQTLALSVRQLLLTSIPGANEIPDAKAKLVGYGYGLGYKDVVATLLLSKKSVKIGLAQGANLSDPSSLLKGAGKVHRYIELRNPEQLHRPEVKQLLEACLTEWRRRMEAKQDKSRKGSSIR